MSNTDVNESCTREQTNTKSKFNKLTNVISLAVLHKEVSIGCKDVVLPETFLRKSNANCLTFDKNTRQPRNDNLCLFGAPELHLHEIEGLEEEIFKLLNLFLEKPRNCYRDCKLSRSLYGKYFSSGRAFASRYFPVPH